MPKPEDIQKEFEDFVQKRFGGQVKVIAQEMPGFQKRPQTQKKVSDKEEQKLDLSFDFKPKDLKVYLDRYIIGQEEAKKALSIAVCDHYNQVQRHQKDPQDPSHENYVKQNVMVLGPTGVGKTYLVRQIAKLIGVPFVKADATRFSETGYIGANVDDLVRDLVNQANGDLQKAQYGIVYLDEIDKLASKESMGKDVNGRGVQMGLLKLMEETDVDLRANHDPASQMQAFMEMQQKGKIEKHSINTRHILFIVSGAFSGLRDIVAKRLNFNQIGFSQSGENLLNPIEAGEELKTQDFIDFGFEPEFVGRLPIRVACTELDEESLFSILKESEGSIIKQYVNSFRSYGIEVKFQEEALREIAAKAIEEKTGARGLMTIMETIFRDYKYFLPSTDLLSLEVDKDLIRNPKKNLAALLENCNEDQNELVQVVKDFSKDFEKKHGMSFSFDRSAIQYLIELSQEEGKSIDILCSEIFQGFEHGLKLIHQNTGVSVFTITDEILKHPRESLEKMVKESYNHSTSSLTH